MAPLAPVTPTTIRFVDIMACKSMNAFSLVACVALGPGIAKTPSVGARIVAHARIQIGWNTRYDPSYVRLSFPGGDLPRDRGVCTDVVVRALRSVGKDLQKLVFEHRRSAGLKTDPNIDHRRCPNLIAFFKKRGLKLSTKIDPETLPSWKRKRKKFKRKKK